MAYKLEQKLCKGISTGKLWSEIKVKDTQTNEYLGVERKGINWDYTKDTELSVTKITCLVKGSISPLITFIDSSGNYKVVTAILEDNLANRIDQTSNNSSDAVPTPDN